MRHGRVPWDLPTVNTSWKDSSIISKSSPFDSSYPRRLYHCTVPTISGSDMIVYRVSTESTARAGAWCSSVQQNIQQNGVRRCSRVHLKALMPHCSPGTPPTAPFRAVVTSRGGLVRDSDGPSSGYPRGVERKIAISGIRSRSLVFQVTASSRSVGVIRPRNCQRSPGPCGVEGV